MDAPEELEGLTRELWKVLWRRGGPIVGEEVVEKKPSYFISHIAHETYPDFRATFVSPSKIVRLKSFCKLRTKEY